MPMEFSSHSNFSRSCLVRCFVFSAFRYRRFSVRVMFDVCAFYFVLDNFRDKYSAGVRCCVCARLLLINFYFKYG